MNKLFFALSLFCSHALIFSAQEAEQAPQLQIEDITPEHFEKIMYGPLRRYESDSHILFFCWLEKETRASRNKATNVIEIEDVITKSSCYFYGGGPEPDLAMEHQRRYEPSLYNKFPAATFNALQVLYEKQQEERKQNS